MNYPVQYQHSPELEVLGHLICRRLNGTSQKIGILRPDLHHKPIPAVFTLGRGYMCWLLGGPHVTVGWRGWMHKESLTAEEDETDIMHVFVHTPVIHTVALLISCHKSNLLYFYYLPVFFCNFRYRISWYISYAIN